MKYCRTKQCLFLLGLALNTPIWADYQSGVQAYQQGDFGLALEEWQKVIESLPADVHPRERAETLYAVAMLFWLGQGVQQDTVTAAGFLRQSAEINHPGAQSKLGYLYLIGQGVPASSFEARKWLEMAARQGDVDAQYNLAVIYRDGIGDTADPVKALQWFEEAAANGDPVSVEVIAEYKRQGALQSAEQAVPTQGCSDTELIPGCGRPLGADSDDPDRAQARSHSGQDPASGEPLGADNPCCGRPLGADSDYPDRAQARSHTGQDPASGEPLGADNPCCGRPLGAESDDPDRAQARSHNQAAVLKDEAWVLAQDETHYTIQVIALKNLQSMQQLIARHPDLEPFAIYLQGDQSRPLYVLVQGDYATVEEARQAQQRFPASLARPEQLWIRRFEMVQDLIRQRKAELGIKASSTHGTH